MAPDTPPALPPRVTFLIGVHKTASTHLKFSLRDRRDALHEAGTRLMIAAQMRDVLIPLSNRLKAGEDPRALRAEVAQRLADHYKPTPEHLIIADENILGGTDPKMLLGGPGFYPWGGNRLGRMLSLFKGCDIRIGMAIRAQASFLVSAYCESLHHTGYQSFDAFLSGHDPRRLSWADLAERVLDSAPRVPLILWRYEDYPANFTEILSHLMGPDLAAKIPPQEGVQHPGISGRAVEELAKAAGRNRHRSMKGLRKLYPKSDKFPALDPWDQGTRAALDDLYADDWIRLISKARVQPVVAMPGA